MFVKAECDEEKVVGIEGKVCFEVMRNELWDENIYFATIFNKRIGC